MKMMIMTTMTNTHGQPPTTEETAEDGDVASSLAVVRLLVELAPQLPHQGNTHGSLPIQLACQAHMTECVRFLFKFPSLMEELDDQGRTPHLFL